jgi:hypothetical protein
MHLRIDTPTFYLQRELCQEVGKKQKKQQLKLLKPQSPWPMLRLTRPQPLRLRRRPSVGVNRRRPKRLKRRLPLLRQRTPQAKRRLLPPRAKISEAKPKLIPLRLWLLLPLSKRCLPWRL